MGAKTRLRMRPSKRKYDKKAAKGVLAEMHLMRSGKHSNKSRKQAAAIGLSKARRKAARTESLPGRAA